MVRSIQGFHLINEENKPTNRIHQSTIQTKNTKWAVLSSNTQDVSLPVIEGTRIPCQFERSLTANPPKFKALSILEMTIPKDAGSPCTQPRLTREFDVSVPRSRELEPGIDHPHTACWPKTYRTRQFELHDSYYEPNRLLLSKLTQHNIPLSTFLQSYRPIKTGFRGPPIPQRI